MDSSMLDLNYLTDSERKMIMEVLGRDEAIQKREDERIARLKSKAARTNNPTIKKKIKMRTGEWFFELMQPNKNFKQSGRETVRASIRVKSKGQHRRPPVPPPDVLPQNEIIVEESDTIVEPTSQYEAEVYSTHSHDVPQPYDEPEPEPELAYEEPAMEEPYHQDDSSYRHDYHDEEEDYVGDINRDKVEEIGGAMNFLQTIDDSNATKAGKKKKTNLIKGNAQSLPSLSIGRRSLTGSTWSVYSAAAHEQSGVDITGSIHMGFSYSYKTGTLNIHIGGCKNLAAMDEKKLSNPYVKTYLLPDKHSKRKTKTKKHTVNPDYKEILKYVVSETELSTRTLNVAVWHDKLGVNAFLGEVNLSCDHFDLAPPMKMQEYDLQAKCVEGVMSNAYSGDIDVALRFVPSTDNLHANGESRLEVVLKNVNNVALKSSSQVYVKGYFLPDKSHETKQKTPLSASSAKVDFDHLFVFTGVVKNELYNRAVELTVYQREKFGQNHLVGGARLGTGTGMSFDKSVPWMDSRNEEMDLWQRMIQSPSTWVSGVVYLRKFEPSK